ncbi:hypothetical protein [Geothrix sp. 21YS21S-4]|uniref:hypothetical protein n=1 Tax=Geothrix sp. 21YS21S-4 TaxID=3068889 RepID=UPI0027B9E035|nr:hypothetical protein [Geothrix sp. 21YS21S-4]
MANPFQAAEASWLSRRGLWLLARLMMGSSAFRRKVRILGETEDYLSWLQSEFGRIRLLKSREDLWGLMMADMDKGAWTVYEFGVAWGYATRHWLSRGLPSVVAWHGFDRFTGLPRAWRDVEEGEFDAQGRPPVLADPRVVWHVGDVEETLPAVEITSTRKCLLFDLDLYEPTAFAWNRLRSHLNPGDLLYFDEAYDQDERRVLVEHLLPEFRLELIGSTTYALALRVVGVRS